MDKESEELQETVAVIKSGTSAVHLCGDDYSRIDEFVTQLASALDFTYTVEEQVMGENGPETQIREKANVIEWNYGYGVVNFETRAEMNGLPHEEKMSFTQFLKSVKDTTTARERIILIRNARLVLEGEANRENLAQLQQTIVHLKKHLPGKTVLIYCDEKRFIPDELSSLVYFLDVKPPSQDELKSIARKFIDKKKLEPDQHLIEKLSSKCVGMSEDSFTQVLKKAAKGNDFAGTVLDIAEKTKKQFVDKSGLLKYVAVDVDIDNNVGGLGNLKWWLEQKKNAFVDPEGAKEWGISPTKGMLLVGMPGCGKSLTSKAVANFFKLPLLSLDLGSLMGKYLGESEENLRRALKLAEHCSPCVLWVDEIEKAFAGVGGDESGVSQRLFGYLLTWLNEKTAQVFVMATANDVAVLPPEFLRRGRFDEIFYVDFPSAPERREIFKIHLGKIIGKKIIKDTGKEELEEILATEKLTKEKLEIKRGKEKIEALLKENDHFREDFDKLTRDKNEGEETYQGTEGYAGSDIAALVNSAIERLWNQKKTLETDIFNSLLKDRKFMTPLKEVLAEKIAKNREKFGQYKLTPASHTKENMQRFEIGSESNSEEDLLKLVKDDDCPPDVLRKLSKRDFKQVKLKLLENPNCPPDCIVNLMEDSDSEVQEKARENQMATPAGIIQIAKDKDSSKELKLSLIKPGIPEEALEILANEGDKEIAAEILKLQSIPEPVWTAFISHAHIDEAFKVFLQQHPQTPERKKKQFEKRCLDCKHFFLTRKRNLICNINCHNYDKKCSYYLFVSEKQCKNCKHFMENINAGSSSFCNNLYMDRYYNIETVEDAPNNCYHFQRKEV